MLLILSPKPQKNPNFNQTRLYCALLACRKARLATAGVHPLELWSSDLDWGTSASLRRASYLNVPLIAMGSTICQSCVQALKVTLWYQTSFMPWFQWLISHMMELNFKKYNFWSIIICEQSKTSYHHSSYLCTDIVVNENHLLSIKNLIDHLNKNFFTKDLDPLQYFLGLELGHNNSLVGQYAICISTSG